MDIHPERVLMYAFLVLVALAAGWAGCVFAKRTDPREVRASLVVGLLGAPLGVWAARWMNWVSDQPEWYNAAAAAGVGALLVSALCTRLVAFAIRFADRWIEFLEKKYGPPEKK